MGLVAEWDLELVGPDGAAKDRRHFKNLIVNAGLNRAKDRLFNPTTVATVFGYVAIGTGAIAETPVDVALGTEAARAAVAYMSRDVQSYEVRGHPVLRGCSASGSGFWFRFCSASSLPPLPRGGGGGRPVGQRLVPARRGVAHRAVRRG